MSTSALLGGLLLGGLCLLPAAEASGLGATVVSHIDPGPLDASVLKISVDVVAR